MSHTSSAPLHEPRPSRPPQAFRGPGTMTTMASITAWVPPGRVAAPLVLAEGAATDVVMAWTMAGYPAHAAMDHHAGEKDYGGRSQHAAVAGHQILESELAVISDRPLSATRIGSASRSHAGSSHDIQDDSQAQHAATPLRDETSADHRRWSTRSVQNLRTLQRYLSRLAAIALIGTVCAGCGSNTKTVASYRPDFLPVALGISPSGISIEGVKSIATPIGTFSIGALYELTPQDPGSIYVILRDRRTGFDHIYRVRTGADQLMAVMNGTTTISITNGQVLIDITDGTIKQVAFKRVSDQISQQHPVNLFAKAWHITAIRWMLLIMIVLYILRRLLRGY